MDNLLINMKMREEKESQKDHAIPIPLPIFSNAYGSSLSKISSSSLASSRAALSTSRSGWDVIFVRY
jgi:hypothetical protein